MKAELILLGKHVDMAPRTRRRTLVMVLYIAMAALMTGLWFVDHWRGTGFLIYWAAILACRMFLGGYYRGGLIKPFNGKGPVESRAPSPLLLRLQLYKPVLADGDDTFRNDERELHQRDHAHYLAYQGLGIALIIPGFVASMRVVHANWFGWLPMSGDQMYYGLGLMMVLLFFTLPQCILLWNEPDMEVDPTS